jgi:glutamate racemase
MDATMMQTTSAPVKIGILDADLGGLPLAAAIASRWPMLSVCYLADTAHRPLGERSPALVRQRIDEGLACLCRQGATQLILASQTMAALGPAAGPAAGFSVIDPLPLAAVAAADASPAGRIGIIASRATVDSGAYRRHVQAHRPLARVHEAAAPLVGPLLDAGRESSPEGRMILKKYLHRLKVRQVDTLILGTSRCGPIAPLIQRKIGRHVRLVDPLVLVLERLAHRLGGEPPPSPGPISSLRLLVTDDGPAVTEVCRRLLRHRVEMERIRL